MNNCSYLNQLQEKYDIVLASRSERRKQLLGQLGIKFTIADTIDVDESFPQDLEHASIVQHIAHNKAKAYKKTLNERQLLITCDTIVVFQGQILGKPKNKQEAEEYLRMLSGSMHSVYTGTCLMTTDQTKIFHAQTNVWFERLTHDEINFYIDTYKPFDKAGGYGIQEWIGMIGIWRIEGSYFNVVGMPIQLIYRELQDFL